MNQWQSRSKACSNCSANIHEDIKEVSPSGKKSTRDARTAMKYWLAKHPRNKFSKLRKKTLKNDLVLYYATEDDRRQNRRNVMGFFNLDKMLHMVQCTTTYKEGPYGLKGEVFYILGTIKSKRKKARPPDRPDMPACETDEDCSVCGSTCISAEAAPLKKCRPPEVDCACRKGRCATR